MQVINERIFGLEFREQKKFSQKPNIFIVSVHFLKGKNLNKSSTLKEICFAEQGLDLPFMHLLWCPFKGTASTSSISCINSKFLIYFLFFIFYFLFFIYCTVKNIVKLLHVEDNYFYLQIERLWSTLCWTVRPAWPNRSSSNTSRPSS